MARRFPGPYQITFSYFTATREHVAQFSCAVVGGVPALGTPPSLINLQTAGGGQKTLQAATQQLWDFYRLVLSNASQIGAFSFWKITPNSDEKTFVTAIIPTNPTGASAGPILAKQQNTATFRTGGGSIARVIWLEGTIVGETKSALVANPTGTAIQRMASYMLSADCVVIGRDNGFPIAALTVASGENERIFKKINRPNS